MKDFSDDEQKDESSYDRLARTREHLLCLWNDHGVKCGKAAVFLTTTLARKTKHLPRGGYCAEHQRVVSDAERAEAPVKSSGGDWRDQLVDAALRERNGSTQTPDEDLRELIRQARALGLRKPEWRVFRYEFPRCGARCRDGHPCQMRAAWDENRCAPRNGRCRIHGGVSTSYRTEEGRKRILEGRQKYWAAWRALRKNTP